MNNRLLLFVFFSLIINIEAFGQQKASLINSIEKQSLKSSVLGEQRELLIYSPSKSKTKMPLILVFDGGGLFNATVSTVQFMTSYSEIPQMPEAVILGIQNTDRNRDMPIPQQYGNGGEENYLKFIKEEVLPWASKKYSLNGHVISIGHSQGAYFTTYLLARSPDIFSWVIALDAPMNVDVQTKVVKEMFSTAIKQPANKIRYASVDATYGWGDQWSKYITESSTAMSKTLEGESHESMALPGLYQGLKFIYQDFSPPKKDLTFEKLLVYYKSISETYGKSYEIPLGVLLSSASQKIFENRKTEVLRTLEYAEKIYGSSLRITKLREQANSITKEPDSIIDFYLNLPKPNIEQAKEFIGKWKGDFTGYRGDKFPYEVQIIINNNIPTLTVRMRNQIEENASFHITDDGKLTWAFKNRGGGIIVTACKLNANGNLVGTRKWLGFTIKDDMPENDKSEIQKILSHKGEFTLRRIE